ncbi:MAG: hypothetical protein ACHQHP_01810 [Bacteroidia bacterium]
MKTSPNNSLLDNFLRDSLKNIDVKDQQPDWNEMETMLGPPPNPISFNLSKKTIFIAASAAVLLVIIIIISQTIHFNNSSSDEIPAEQTNSPQNLLNATDTQQTITAQPVLKVDSAKKDSSASMLRNKIVDSVKVIASSDTASLRRINDKQKNSLAKTSQNQDKKKKKNHSSPDSSSEKTNIEQIPAADTASKHPAPEIKSATSPTQADSSKSKKNKKQKKSFIDFFKSKSETPVQPKPDSLKK